MIYSKGGMAFTERFESCRLEAYQDVKGVWTIGWGHTGPEVKAGLVWSQVTADAQLLEDVRFAVAAVNTVKATLNQHEFDALVDFVFNCGVTAFFGSTLRKLLESGDHHGAANEFEKWDHAGGKVVAGLLRRRLAERDEFNS